MTNSSVRMIPAGWEGPAWMAAALSLNGLYLYGAFAGTAALFGIGATRGLSPALYSVLTIAALAAGLLLGWVDPPLPIGRRATVFAAAALSWPVFFLLRTHTLNQDGNALAPKFEADVPRLGAHLTHDELLELFLHSRVWYYTHRWWGWSVVFSYQVVSCIAGACFVYLLLRLAPRVAPVRTWLFLAGALSGGYLQLFFGDAENYTVTAAIMIGYLIASARFLAGEVPLWVPAVALALAMSFHLETAWALPSLLYLALVSRRRHGNLRETAISALLGLGLGLLTVGYFHFHGLPVWRFFSSHAGHAIRMNGVFSVGMPARYYVEQVDLLIWLCPAIGMLVPLALWRRPLDMTATHFAITAASMLLLQVIWKAQLGVYDDWNLYAIGGMLAAVFIWQRVAALASTTTMRMAAASIAVAAGLHTAAWIVVNHVNAR